MRLAERITQGPIGVGTSFRAEMTGKARVVPMTIEVTEFDRPRRQAERVDMKTMDLTGGLTMAFGRRSPGASRSLWLGFAVAIGSIWFVVAIASIFAPSIVTGTDPTTVPIAALASPIAGLIATAFVSVFVAGSVADSKR